jgi:hypothetical protein
MATDFGRPKSVTSVQFQDYPSFSQGSLRVFFYCSDLYKAQTMPATDYTGFWKVVYDWQTLITGMAAVFGGLVAYQAGRTQANATREAANRQIAALVHKDRLQARGIAVAIYPI